MRITMLSALFLAGLASTVSAEVVKSEPTARFSYQEKSERTEPKAPPDVDREGWVELADATPASHGREYIMVGAAAGTFRRLKVVAVSGRPTIKSVRVDFKTGKSRVVKVDKTLTTKYNRIAVIDLNGDREIKQVVVVSDYKSRGKYRLLAEPTADEIATR